MLVLREARELKGITGIGYHTSYHLTHLQSTICHLKYHQIDLERKARSSTIYAPTLHPPAAGDGEFDERDGILGSLTATTLHNRWCATGKSTYNTTGKKGGKGKG